MSQYVAIAKIDETIVVSHDDDEVIPSNLGALKMGLEAMKAEDSQDLARSRSLWAEAKALLAEESEDETGAGATGTVDMADDFQMGRIHYGDYLYG